MNGKMINDPKEHVFYIDFLRIFGMFCVVFLHEAGVAMNRLTTDLDFELLNIAEGLVYAAVPLFFMISGYLILSSKRTTDVSVLLGKRLPRLLVPLVCWSLATSVWQGHLADDYSVSSIVQRFLPFLNGPVVVHFWFMYTLIALYLASPVLYGVNHLDRKGRIYLLVVILILNIRWVLYGILPTEIYSRFLKIDLLDELLLFGGNLCTFFLGWYLGNLKKRIPNALLIGVSVLTLVIITLGSRSFYFRNGSYDPPYHSQSLGFEILLAACFFLLAKQNLDRDSKFLRSFLPADLTFTVYLMHIITMELLFGFGLTPDSFLTTLAFSLVNYLLCFLLAKCIASIKPFCFLATGIRFQEACATCNWFCHKKENRHQYCR